MLPRPASLCALTLFATAALAAAAPVKMDFTISIPQPATHTLHVHLRADGLARPAIPCICASAAPPPSRKSKPIS